MSIILFIIILLVLVLVHEFGHFIVAKKNGIRVDEFGFGFPPRAAKLFKKNGTLYTLNWIPFGGFVKIFGEDGDEAVLSDEDKKSSFTSKPRYVQAGVLVAGIVFNILLAWLLYSVGFMSGLPASTASVPADVQLSSAQLTLIEVDATGPAFRAGLIPGDVIVSIADEKTSIAKPSVDDLITFVKAHPNKNISVTYNRATVEKTISITPAVGITGATTGGIGVTPDMVGTLKLPFFKAFYSGAKLTIAKMRETIVGFGQLISGHQNLSDVAGPVGLVSIVGQAYHFGWSYLISFVALISINLAVINLVPFPALDGGRLLFLLIEKIKGSRIKAQTTNIVNAVGFFILIGLMLVITYHDIVRMFVHK